MFCFRDLGFLYSFGSVQEVTSDLNLHVSLERWGVFVVVLRFRADVCGAGSFSRILSITGLLNDS